MFVCVLLFCCFARFAVLLVGCEVVVLCWLCVVLLVCGVANDVVLKW